MTPKSNESAPDLFWGELPTLQPTSVRAKCVMVEMGESRHTVLPRSVRLRAPSILAPPNCSPCLTPTSAPKTHFGVAVAAGRFAGDAFLARPSRKTAARRPGAGLYYISLVSLDFGSAKLEPQLNNVPAFWVTSLFALTIHVVSS
jgi:hypothetical protein